MTNTLAVPVEIERIPMRLHRYAVTVVSPSDPQMAMAGWASTRWGARRLARTLKAALADSEA